MIDFETPLFLIPVMCGGIFVLVGVIMWYFPPKKINALYGYRTVSSMKSQKRWDFAQKYSAVEMIKWGAVFMLTAILSFMIKFDPFTGMCIGLGLMILMVVLLLVRTERAIKQHFKNNE